jgi:hypothetical protein
MMFLCGKAQSVWRALGLMEMIQEALQVDLSGCMVLEHLLGTKLTTPPGLNGLPIHEIIVIAAWFIWWKRREIKSGGIVPLASRTALSIKSMVTNCVKAKKTRGGCVKKGRMKPPSGFVKLNTDAALNLDTRRAMSGCIIRDSTG